MVWYKFHATRTLEDDKSYNLLIYIRLIRNMGDVDIKNSGGNKEEILNLLMLLLKLLIPVLRALKNIHDPPQGLRGRSLDPEGPRIGGKLTFFRVYNDNRNFSL